MIEGPLDEAIEELEQEAHGMTASSYLAEEIILSFQS
jgi:hypothetical protein